jgi:protein gp37
MLQAMNRADNQTFMLLTKRADILMEVLDTWLRGTRYAPQNIWLGVSVENQSTANTRLPYLAEIGDRLKVYTFVSFEPLLEPVLLGDYAKYIDLAIVGAESGKGARPMDEDWVRSLRDEVKAANKSFFYKQNVVNGRKVSLPELDGKVWSELP